MTRMKAAVLEEPGRFSVQEVPRPAPKGGEILVRVLACGICGSDLRAFRHGHINIELPHILGHEIAGVVAEGGPQEKPFAAGDRVVVTPKIFCGRCSNCRRGLTNFCEHGRSFGHAMAGGFAEHVLVPAEGATQDIVIALQGVLEPEEAAMVEPVACCLRAMRSARPSCADSVVVIGGGPMGTVHGRLARHFGVDRVILIEHNEGRLARADRQTFELVVDSRRQPPVEAVMEATDGRGADIIVVACSSRQAQIDAMRMAGTGARVDFFSGLPTGAEPVPVDTNWLHYQGVSLRSSRGATYEDYRQAVQLLQEVSVRVEDLITHRSPLEAIQDTFEALERGDGMKGVVVP